MRNLLNPKWLIVLNTIPILILFFIFWGEYTIIKSLLNEESIHLWKWFGLALVILGLLNLAYGIFLILKKKLVSLYYGIIALVSYITFLYIYGNYADEIIPSSIPQWMVPDTMILYVGTFLMPTLAYSLFILVTHFTPSDKESKAWKSFLAAISIPISWYLFSQLILPFWKPVGYGFSSHALIIFIIIGTLTFLFFLIRTVYILGIKKATIWKKYQLTWKIPISIVLPLLGLAVNNGHLFNGFRISNSGVFGNFNNHWFYILAVLNGIFICLPNSENKIYRLLLFIGRTITFAYTFYFFLVFLPFLPLSVVAIIAIGTGFLMLTPLVLFIIHINEISKDFTFLKTHFSKILISIITLLSFLAIPVYITTSYVKDKNVLNETLNYVYSPDYSKEYNIDKNSLSKTLAIVKQHKEKNRGGIFGTQLPYLSSYFNWLVLDNLTLSDAKIKNIETIFFDTIPFELRQENIRNEKVKISKISSSSRFDKTQNTWISWVDLEITNENENSWVSEYATTIELPVGCWISDYYLFVGDKKEMGILAEKKSAMWVFSQIRNENRDPGILYYLTGNKVAFRVFPFAKEEVRKTGIEFIHKEPIRLNIDNQIVDLGKPDEQIQVEIAKSTNKDIVYISTKEKTTLDKVQRKPYYHFIIDASKGKEGLREENIQRIKSLLNKNSIENENTQVSFANTYTSSSMLDDNWEKVYKNQKFEGGFYLERAIKTILFNSYKSKSNSYPILVVVTDSIQNAIITKDFSDFKITFPENDLFYNLDKIGNLKPYSLLSNTTSVISDTLELKFNQTVLAYPNAENPIAFLPNNNQASIVLKNDLFEVDNTQIVEKNWQSALIMQGKWTSQVLHPETSKREWLNLVKYSFISKIMTPLTSYLVVENEAQKAILKKKQEQVLSSNKLLDLGEGTQRMTEPSLLLLVILLGVILWLREKRKQTLIS